MGKNFIEVSDKLNFLLIDGSDAVLATLKQVLRNLGLKNLFSVSNAPSAVEMMKLQKIDFIFCENDLRDVSGMDFLKDIRENVSIDRVPFLMMGHEITRDDVFLSSEFGIDAYLKKPFVMRDISNKLSACIDRFNQKDSAEASFEKARRLLFDKNYKEASKIYESLLPELPESARIRVGLARCARHMGDLNTALIMLNEAIAKNNLYVHAYHELGLIYVQFGRFNEALQNFRKAIELSPKNPVRYELAVDIFLKWDLLNEAEELLINADKLRLLYPGINYKLAQVMMKQRKFDRAISYLIKDLKRDPENLISINDLGLCFQELKNFDEALVYYNKSLRKKSDSVEVLYNKMKCQIETRQLDSALRTCHKILKIQPNHPARSKLDALVHGEKPAA